FGSAETFGNTLPRRLRKHSPRYIVAEQAKTNVKVTYVRNSLLIRHVTVIHNFDLSLAFVSSGDEC
ncbi:hypothetical protein ACJMK2_035746, partial [Sinanodonta woodiana]